MQNTQRTPQGFATEAAHQFEDPPDMLGLFGQGCMPLAAGGRWPNLFIRPSNGVQQFKPVIAEVRLSQGLFMVGGDRKYQYTTGTHFLVCRYLVAQCHYACVEYEEALNILEDSEKCPSHLLNTSITALVTGCLPKCHTPNNSGQKLDKSLLARVRNSLSSCAENELLGGFTWKSLQSSVALLKGKIHEGLENRVVAVQYYREALILDVTCYEAFEKLIHFQSATALEEITLLVQLDFAGQLEPKLAKLVEFLYEDKISKHCTPSTKIPEELDALHENVDLAVNMAGRMLDLCQFQKCYDITSKKASQLDKCFGPTWLALGHAFASDGEHDQAIASYCTAAQVIQGSHVPIMYIGIEYSASNNRNLADRFLFQAYKLNSSDPFIMHEFGTLAFQKQE
ncbi:anaphase-promoting complex subunit 6 [Paragonimus westermani]|uniref:Anaphase-promoting complex subunit 6 n=1 Tax=Paragonimus westermani TaxID=34504 RepID=A0A5J4NKT3_9TREM|nr:anaphase-promoting complex subunit 6 [Paragonimus westermani]